MKPSMSPRFNCAISELSYEKGIPPNRNQSIFHSSDSMLSFYVVFLLNSTFLNAIFVILFISF